jgi:hypothetical protein
MIRRTERLHDWLVDRYRAALKKQTLDEPCIIIRTGTAKATQDAIKNFNDLMLQKLIVHLLQERKEKEKEKSESQWTDVEKEKIRRQIVDAIEHDDQDTCEAFSTSQDAFTAAEFKRVWATKAQS